MILKVLRGGKVRYIRAVLFSLLMFAASPAVFSAPKLTPLDSSAGQQLLFHAFSPGRFLQLTRYYVTQKTQAYCGVASAVMVLNALGVTPPIAPNYYPYAMFNQNTIFTPGVLKQGVWPALVNHQGLTLGQLAAMLRDFGGVHVDVVMMDPKKLDLAQTRLAAALKQAGNEVIVNFSRQALGQEGGGHFSVLGAYDPSKQQALILDVARYKYAPFWVGVYDLVAAMNTTDGVSKRQRGFLVVSPLRVSQHKASS
jgi:hypothetical protein